MRVLYIHQYFATPSDAGGIRSFQLANRMADRGASVTILTTRAMRSRRHFPIRERIGDGVTVYSLPSRYDNSLGVIGRVLEWGGLALVSSLLVFLLRPTIIYCTSTPPSVLVPAFVGRWARGTPFIFEVRDVWPDAMVGLGRIRHGGRLHAWMSRLVEAGYREASRVVVLSPDMGDAIAETGTEWSKILVAPNGHTGLEHAGHRCHRCADLHRSVAGCAHPLIYAGTVGEVNDLAAILPVIDLLPDSFVLHVVGSGSRMQALRQDARSRGLTESGRVVFWGPIPKRCLLSVMPNVRAAISTVADSPALWANSANKVFDAWGSGVPVILNHGGWLAKLAITRKAGVRISTRDTQGAVHAIRQLAEPSEWEVLRGGSLEVAQAVTWDRIYETVEHALVAALHNA